MGLTNRSTGVALAGSGLKLEPGLPVIALAGNPNVGKSTIFNNLTGMKQHTGNWPGKTVSCAQGRFCCGGTECILVDLPGTYSLMAHSAEEEAARNFICFDRPDVVVAVCDATCLERSLNLALQIMELSSRVVICINLMDEARRKGIAIDLALLERRLGVPVVGVSGRSRKSLSALTEAISSREYTSHPFILQYPDMLETMLLRLEPAVRRLPLRELPPRWISLKLLENDGSLTAELASRAGDGAAEVFAAAGIAQDILADAGADALRLKDMAAAASVATAERICSGAVSRSGSGYSSLDRCIDRLLTGRLCGYPMMFLLLALIFWLTIVGANYPSQLLSAFFARIQDMLSALFTRLNAPDWLHGALVMGVYRVLTWVVSVMLPPMAIFFPLFTLLEDVGYLPRVAYILDRPFKRCHACGKQALCMAMGFGCNAAGIVGCRIIDSPRERLLAILTNSFVPCNGRFPALIALITIFFSMGSGSSFLSALLMTALILFSVGMTFAATKLLSATLLKGVPSAFTLELPPYRKPQTGKIIIRSIFDRTLFVLGRAAAVAAPAGLIIWVFANVNAGGESLLSHCAGFLDPFARLMGLDGVILMAFILGFPANEIVMPIVIMAYTAQGSLLETGSLTELRQLLISNGWTWITAASTVLFSLLHWPCSTAMITAYRETHSVKWTLLTAALPTAAGILICTVFNFAARLFI